jgi:hypothetical protein
MKKIIYLFSGCYIGPSQHWAKYAFRYEGLALERQSDGWILGNQLAKSLCLVAREKSRTVVVAVIDSGIDTLQNDIKDVFWTNPGEIPNNNIDDDNNGYVDDVHGWNFLGALLAKT